MYTTINSGVDRRCVRGIFMCYWKIYIFYSSFLYSFNLTLFWNVSIAIWFDRLSVQFLKVRAWTRVTLVCFLCFCTAKLSLSMNVHGP